MTTHVERRALERRRRSPWLRITERRTGFDRRRPSGSRVHAFYYRKLEAYRDNPTVIASILVGIVVLNAADLLLTLRAFDLGAREANPVMRWLFAWDTGVAAIIKMSLATGVAAVIWWLRRYRRLLEVSLLFVAGYGALVLYHLVSLARVS